MSEDLPKGWGETTLDDLSDFVLGGDWGKAPAFSDPTYVEVLCIRGTELKNWERDKASTASIRKVKKTSLDKRKLAIGDLLIEISGGGPDQPVGRVEIIDSDVLSIRPDIPKICTNFLRLFRPSNEIDSNYLYLYLKYFYVSGDVVFYQSGSNNLRNLKFKEYIQISIPLPPFNEQKRIADKLDVVLGAVARCKARLDKAETLLKRFRQSTLNAATTGKLTEDWREENNLEFDWEERPLFELTSSSSYGSSKKSEKTGVVPVLRMGNIQNGKIDWNNLAFSNDDAEIKKYMLEDGDVLFNRTNSPELVGKTAIFKGARRALYAGYLIRVKTTDELMPEYLNICLNSPYGKDYCQSVKTDGVSQSNINAKKLAALPIHYPPIEEQREIVRRVESLFAAAERIEAAIKSVRQRLNRLEASLLAKAFRGELVPQDPTDEPASEFLNRIKAEREATKPKTKRKKTA